MASAKPEHSNMSESEKSLSASEPNNDLIETMNLKDLNLGSDRSAGSPYSWEIVSPPQVTALEPQNLDKLKEEFQPPHTQKNVNDQFSIKLDVFEGPLELLLHLIREHKLDIYDIPIAFITEQYLRHIEMMKLLNINIASDYLVMASWLVYIKSRTLLPQQGGAEESEEDPEALRLELQSQLLEYQKFKGISQIFRDAEEVQSAIFPRGGNGDGIILNPEDFENPPPLEVTVFDLISAIQKMIEEAGEEGIHLVEVDELEVADRQTHVLDMLENSGPEGVEFENLFKGNGPKRLIIVVTLLAILELIRLSLIIATQSEIYGEIRVHKAIKDDE